MDTQGPDKAKYPDDYAAVRAQCSINQDHAAEKAQPALLPLTPPEPAPLSAGTTEEPT